MNICKRQTSYTTITLHTINNALSLIKESLIITPAITLKSPAKYCVRPPCATKNPLKMSSDNLGPCDAHAGWLNGPNLTPILSPLRPHMGKHMRPTWFSPRLAKPSFGSSAGCKVDLCSYGVVNIPHAVNKAEIKCKNEDLLFLSNYKTRSFHMQSCTYLHTIQLP